MTPISVRLSAPPPLRASPIRGRSVEAVGGGPAAAYRIRAKPGLMSPRRRIATIKKYVLRAGVSIKQLLKRVGRMPDRGQDGLATAGGILRLRSGQASALPSVGDREGSR